MKQNKIILGTVQMGLDYGINNSNGQISKDECFEILKYCKEIGVDYLDTADSYGDSISVISEFILNSQMNFQIINKFDKFINLTSFENNIKNVLKNLKIDYFDTYMFHNFALLSNDLILSILNNYKKEGYIKRIGVSVYSNEQFEIVINNENIDVIQFPFNLFDNVNQRFKLILLAKKNNKELHARSIFLQGLFCKKNEFFDEVFNDLESELNLIKELSTKYNLSIPAMALQYVLSIKEIDRVIIGVDSLNHLKENIINSLSDINKELLAEINNINIKNINLLNPSNWKKK